MEDEIRNDELEETVAEEVTPEEVADAVTEEVAEEVAEEVTEEVTPEEEPAQTTPDLSERLTEAFDAISELRSRLDQFERFVNEALAGIDRTEADEAEDTYEDTGDYEEDEVAQLDKAFYERQANYLREGGY